MHAVAVLLLLVQAPVLQKDGLQFKDLNRNGVVDPYEDWRLSPEQRARDLVARMTLEEKAGTMMHGTVRAVGGPMAAAGMGGQYDTASARALIDSVKVTNLITRLNADPRTLAAANNVLQAIAERTRLGIPLTISTDPRNHFQYLPGVSSQTTFSQWPEALGFAAVDDTALTRAFGDIARQEYRAVGIHMALSPQAAGVMPTYSVLEGATWDGKPIEPVGAGFNRQLLTDVLRGRYGFQGVVVTDWSITRDCPERCKNGVPAGERPSFADVGMPWGVEDLPMRGRFVKAVQAGVDEFGGTERADVLVDAVHARELSEARVDSSV